MDLDRYYLGDCRDLLPQVESNSIDCMLTDPPYGMGKGKWDEIGRDLVDFVVSQAVRVLKPTGSFYWFGRCEKTAENWSAFTPLNPRWLTWFFRNSSNINHRTWSWNSNVIVYGHLGDDPVFNLDEVRVPYSQNTNTRRVNHDDRASGYGIHKGGVRTKKYDDRGRKPMDVLEFPSVTAGISKSEGRWHPTQKPLDLMEYLIRASTNAGDVVLDPFSGSGTTLLAARNLGRHFIGFERDEGFYDTMRQRLGT